jgi:urease accessory protein
MQPRKRFGPLSVQRPFYPENECCHVYLLHPPGGVVGGDQLELKIQSDEKSHALITAPGANKFYQSAGEYAQFNQYLKLEQNACLEFLPHENIYFPGARVNALTHIDARQDSRLIFWEKHCFGLPASQQIFSDGLITNHLQLRIDDQLVLNEKQRVDAQEIENTSGFRGFAVTATLLIVAPDLDKQIVEVCRDLALSEGYVGITRPDQRFVVIRYLGPNTQTLNRFFISLWEQCRPLVMQREPCAPRIWNT